MTTSAEDMNAAAVAAQYGGERERAALYEIMRPFVIAMMQRNGWHGMPENQRREFDQAIWVGVWEALETFDPEAGAMFSTFAHHHMKGGAMTWLRLNGAKPMSARQWKLRGALEREAAAAYPGRHWSELADSQLAALEVPSLDKPGAVRTVADAGDLLRAGRADRLGSTAIDRDDYLEESAPSAEADYFTGPAQDKDRDALETLAAMQEALAAGASPSEVRGLAFDYVDRHDLGDEIARRLIKAAEKKS